MSTVFEIFSPHMLKTFELCPKKFEFKYVKGISMPVNDEIYETGKYIHALASYYLRNENIDKMENSLNDYDRELWDYLKNSKYFSYKTVNTEYNLACKIGEYFFGGRLDALVKNNEYYYIIDYKTGVVPKNPKYDYQTMIYLLCVHEFFKTDNVTFVYLDVKNKNEILINLTPELVNDYKQKLIQTAEKISREEFSYTNNCMCEYKIICYH